MKGLLLLSHGSLAKGLYDTTTWFFGEDIPQCDYLTLSPSDIPEQFTEAVNAKVAQLNTGEGVVILCDLFGGSPFKCSLESALKGDQIKLITGMNLPMVMEFLGKRLCDEYDFEGLIKTAKEGIIDFNTADLLVNDEDE